MVGWWGVVCDVHQSILESRGGYDYQSTPAPCAGLSSSQMRHGTSVLETSMHHWRE